MDELKKHSGENVVLDTKGPFLYVGELLTVQENSVVLKNADVHDKHSSNTSSERYLIDTKKFGIRMNRKSVTVLQRELISFSLLEDVHDY